MLKKLGKVEEYDGSSIDSIFKKLHGEEPNLHSLKTKMGWLMNVVRSLPVNGCITGSCLLPGFDPDAWGTKPDIDVFVYGEKELVHAVDMAMYGLKMVPGDGTQRSRDQEMWKIRRLYDVGVNRQIGVTTYKFSYDGVILNITFKQMRQDGKWYPIVTAPDVLHTFDMSIIMQAIDIRTNILYDFRVGDPMVATPNPMRRQDFDLWTVAKWVRQWDRVVKYYQRIDAETGRNYDTRPMAQFYLESIDGCIANGSLFDSEESNELFDSFKKEFEPIRDKISKWIEEHKED